MTGRPRPTLTVEEYLSDYRPEVRDIAVRARLLVLSVYPDAVEYAHSGYEMIMYGTGLKTSNMVFYISAHESHADIGLFGVGLPDPTGLMKGTGKDLRPVEL